MISFEVMMYASIFAMIAGFFFGIWFADPDNKKIHDMNKRAAESESNRRDVRSNNQLLSLKARSLTRLLAFFIFFAIITFPLMDL